MNNLIVEESIKKAINNIPKQIQLDLIQQYLKKPDDWEKVINKMTQQEIQNAIKFQTTHILSLLPYLKPINNKINVHN